jgi:putative ABC transport system permease protein
VIPFLSVRLAFREGRAGVRRIGVFMGAVALGVGALTGLYGFQQDAADGVRAEARALLGGDLRLQSSTAFGDEARAVLDSLRAEGVRVSETVSLASVVFAPGSGVSRFLQVQAVDGSFPLVGSPETAPTGSWPLDRGVAAEPGVLRQLGVGVGESVRIGPLELTVRAAVQGLPVDVGVQSLVGPPIFVPLEVLLESGLLGFGSLAQYRAFLVLPDGDDPARMARALRERLNGTRVGVETAEAQAEELADGFRLLSRFLGLVGLVALLLGGIGVASAVHVYVRERISSIAVLRCLGASEGTVFRVYLVQALALGAGGALLGVLLGTLVQFTLPWALRGSLPFEPNPRLRFGVIGAGLGVGTWVSFLFALLPLLRVREIPPLAALRSEVEGASLRRILPRVVAVVGLGVTLFALSAAQVGGVREGLAFAVALGGVLAVLALLSRILAEGARRLLPPGAPFVVRQGISGLFRPGNQTGAVLTSLGFGAFLMGSILVVEAGLRARLTLDPDGGEPGLVLFDVQSDQLDGVSAALSNGGLTAEFVPLVPARIESIRGIPVDSLAASNEIPGWASRRVYRNTFRAEISPTERVLEGSWSSAGDPDDIRAATEGGARRISMERDLARDLGVGIGDLVGWDIQGRVIPSVITSIREVDWSGFRPNFFVVFEDGALEGAPTTWVGLVRDVDPAQAMALQDAISADAANVSVLDVSAVLETVVRVSRRVLQVLRSLAVFATAGGFLVLFAALLTGRFRRRRESALLKTLGAQGRTIRGILLTEYAVLGAVGAGAGLLLGAGGGAILLRRLFEIPLETPWGLLGVTWGGLIALTVLAGWSVSGPVLREPPLVVLRDAG